jgi:hypothetical protein
MFPGSKYHMEENLGRFLAKIGYKFKNLTLIHLLAVSEDTRSKKSRI